MKIATFTVHATEKQSLRWKRAAEGEAFASVGSWLAAAADAYMDARARAGRPIPLAWRKGRFRVMLEDREAEVPGFVSAPFGAFRGAAAGRGLPSCHRYTLVYVPAGRILATMRTFAQCKALAAELARLWVRGDGSEPSGNPAPVIPAHPA
ncbi:MAG TPA: hypothetical protein VGG20_24545 [Thermoanaerobaculia bacterium]